MYLSSLFPSFPNLLLNYFFLSWEFEPLRQSVRITGGKGNSVSHLAKAEYPYTSFYFHLQQTSRNENSPCIFCYTVLCTICVQLKQRKRKQGKCYLLLFKCLNKSKSVECVQQFALFTTVLTKQ